MKFISFFLLLILSLDTFSIPCTQIPTTVPEESSVKSLHDPCASGNSNPNPPDSHFERFIVIGERIAEGEGPPIINVATGGAPLGGFPGGTSSGNGEPGPNGGNTAKKRSCVLFAGAPSGIGVVAKSCKGFTDPNNKAFKVMLEDFKDEVSSQAQDHVRALVKKAMPALPERILEGISIEAQDLVTGDMLDAQIDAILNDVLSEMRAYFNEFDIEPLDGDDSFADLENQIVAHSLRSLNQREAPRIDLRDYEAPITRNFRASGGAFGKKIQNLTDRLDASSPSEEHRVRAKKFAYVAADVADQENYLGHRENADLALEIATELTDFALSVTPIVSVAKDAYELFYGVNEITGEELTKTDRAFAALGLLTLGSSNFLKGGGKLLKKIGSEVAIRFPGVLKKGANAAIDKGQTIYDSAWKSPPIKTPFGKATQEMTKDAMTTRAKVQNGDFMYRLGKRGRSQTGKDAQFWSLEHPKTLGYSQRYGIPEENIANADFIERATIKDGSNFVTRKAPPVGNSKGGGIEIVTTKDGVSVESHSSLD